jgi:TetR/AcrR family transcriptional repressor of nem operon
MTDAFVISRLAFLVVVGLASFAGSAVLGRLFVRQPERLRVALWWLLAVILALSCAWVSGGWPFPPRESQLWIGYVLLFAALLRSIAFPTAQLISALASATLAIVVTLLPIAQNGWGPLMFGSCFFVSLLSYLIVQLVLHKEFETASLRASLLLAVPLFVSAVMLFFAGSTMLAELAVAGGIAVAATYLSQRSSALGHGFVEITLLFHFLLADLGAAVAKRYWENAKADLEKKLADSSDPIRCLRDYPDMFRRSLGSDNRICLCSFMGAEYDDLPGPVKKEVQTFADVNVAWLSKVLSAARVVKPRAKRTAGSRHLRRRCRCPARCEEPLGYFSF